MSTATTAQITLTTVQEYFLLDLKTALSEGKGVHGADCVEIDVPLDFGYQYSEAEVQELADMGLIVISEYTITCGIGVEYPAVSFTKAGYEFFTSQVDNKY